MISQARSERDEPVPVVALYSRHFLQYATSIQAVFDHGRSWQDKLYRKSGFKSERERIEHLFGLYEKMTSGMLATAKKPRKRKAATKP